MKNKLKRKMTKRELISYQKNFVLKGKQQDESQVYYYYQSNLVFNIIKPFIKKLIDLDIDESLIWGKDSVADILIPYQMEYNKVKNKYLDILNNFTLPLVMVEDGSVDVDALCDDGICPGKVLVFRQGSVSPNISTVYNTEDIESLYRICDYTFTSFVDACRRVCCTVNVDKSIVEEIYDQFS